jgi:hypothetical protein
MQCWPVLVAYDQHYLNLHECLVESLSTLLAAARLSYLRPRTADFYIGPGHFDLTACINADPQSAGSP